MTIIARMVRFHWGGLFVGTMAHLVAKVVTLERSSGQIGATGTRIHQVVCCSHCRWRDVDDATAALDWTLLFLFSTQRD